jgi:hypothetical protein
VDRGVGGLVEYDDHDAVDAAECQRDANLT